MHETLKQIIQEAFRCRIGQQCAKAVWSELDRVREGKLTERKRHGRERVVKGVSQTQIANNVFRAQGRVSKWFSEGSTDWNNLVMVMTDLDMEFFDFSEPLPQRDTRVLEARKAALMRCVEVLHEMARVEELSDEELHCLILLKQSQDWRLAKLVKDSDQRKKRRAEAVRKIVEEAEAQLQRSVVMRDPELYVELERKWGEAWDRCADAILVTWSVK